MADMYKVITHVHTKYSYDSMLPFSLLYRKCRKCGIDYIAITEHNNIDGAKAFQAYCEKRGGKLKVILGEEVMTDSGEIIGLYIHENIKPLMTPEETIQEIKRQGGVVYVPHPYDEKRYKTVLKEIYIEKYKEEIDCIECHNGRNISTRFDEKQKEIAEKYKIRKIIGSDAHTIFEVGRNYMLMASAPDSADAFREALASADFHPAPCVSFCHQITRIDRLLKLLSKGDYRELYQIIHKKLRGKKP